MKSFFRGLWVAALVPCVVEADIYHGTITQTIEPYSDQSGWFQGYEMGATYLGYYEYESSTIDGTFYVAGLWSEIFSMYLGYTVNSSLIGSVFLPFPDYSGYGSGPHWNSLGDTRHGGTLTVSGGVVTGFEWYFESGGLYSDFSTTFFSAFVYSDLEYFFPGLPPEEWYQPGLGGTLTFSAPRSLTAAPPSEVPDNGSPSSLLALVFVVLGLARRRSCPRP